MVALNEYIKESLLRDFDDIENLMDPRKDIEEFIKNNYTTKGKLRISKKPNSSGKYEVSCLGASILDKNITSLTNNMFVWLNIRKDFICSQCNSLKTLEGSPKEIGGSFDCSECESLTSLKGAPKKVGWSFQCAYCSSLKTLEGAPKEVGGGFSCYGCISLTSLEGAPEKIPYNFNCSKCSSLKTLEGAPKYVGGGFSCYGCTSLTSLEGAPQEAHSIFCHSCGKTFEEDEVKKYIKITNYINI